MMGPTIAQIKDDDVGFKFSDCGHEGRLVHDDANDLKLRLQKLCILAQRGEFDHLR